MVNFTISVEDADVANVVAALSQNWTETIEDVDGEQVANPLTQAQFANQTCRQWISGQVSRYLRKQAASAVNTTITLVDGTL